MLVPVLIVVDAGTIGLALALAFYLRYGSGLWLRRSPFALDGFLVFSALAVLEKAATRGKGSGSSGRSQP